MGKLRNKQIAEDKQNSKTDIEFVAKLLTRLLYASDFSNEQTLQLIQEHKITQEGANIVIDTIKDFIENLKSKQIQTIVNLPRTVEIENELKIERPEWTNELKINTKEIERRLKNIARAIEDKEVVKEVAIKNEIAIKKPSWYKEINVTSIVTEITSWFDEFINSIIDRRFFKIKTEKPLDVVIVDRRGKAIDIKALGGSTVQSGGFIMSGGGSSGIFEDMNDNRKTVTVAGTREQIAIATPCSKVIITAMISNTGYVVVGGSTVVAAEATRRGIPLVAGQSMEINIGNLSKIYIDAEVTGEGITYIYF